MGFQVDYIDTDAMGVAHHGSYLRWMERCRVEWLRSFGLSYLEMEKDGYILPLREARLAYKKPLYFDDHPTIHVRVDRLRMAGVDLVYEIRKDGEIMTTGFTSHVVCLRGTEDGKSALSPVRIPEKWRKLWLEQSEKKP